MLKPVLLGLLTAALSYFICGVPFGLLIAKASGVDVRTQGSGNIGTTNVARSVGATASIFTLLLDASKGALCVLLARWLIPSLSDVNPNLFARGASLNWLISLVALACVCGHIYSPYLKLKGGKGIAVGLGVLLGLDWPIALILLFAFLVVALVSKYVSLGSITAALLLPICAYLRGYTWTSLTLLLAISLIVLYAHRENIRKLLSGTESKFSIKSKDEKGSE